MSDQVSAQAKEGVAPLSVQLRQGTRSAHRLIEKAQFVRAFLKGLLCRTSYLQYLRDLLLVYETMEQQLTFHARTPQLAPVFLPKLFRAETLRADLCSLHGKDWEKSIFPSRNAQRYAQHLRSIACTSPYLLAAHAYTRYLGDLSGGQILGPLAKVALGLPGPAGLAFYDFPLVDDLAAMRALYRHRLDCLPLSAEEQQQVVKEACQAFEWNRTILSDLPAPSIVRRPSQTRSHVAV